MKFLRNKQIFVCFFVFLFYLINIKIVFADISNRLEYYKENLYSDSVLMINQDTDTIIVEKNPDKHRSPASLTKILTFIVEREQLQSQDLNTKIIVKEEVLKLVDPDSSGVKLKVGEEVSIDTLEKSMLISSSGYAAMVLADYAGGSVENFVNLMNGKLVELGCENTHFVNPDGIYHENQYSTARDMYKICKYAMNIPGFLDIVSQSECDLFNDNRDPVVTTNSMIDIKRGGKYYCPWVKGIKTGYTSESGRCLISYAVNKNVNQSYVTVAMGAPVVDQNNEKIRDNLAMIDTLNLYNWAFNNLKIITVYYPDIPVTDTNLNYVFGTDKLLLYPAQEIKVIVPKNITKENLSLTYDIPDNINAPVHKNNKIGTAHIIYNNKILQEFDLISADNFKKSNILVCYKFVKTIITHPIFITIFIIILSGIGLYVSMILKQNRKDKYKNKAKYWK